MLEESPLIHVGIERTFRNADGYSDKVTINLSRIPATASAGLIDEMLKPAREAISRLLDEADRISEPATTKEFDLSAFGGPTHCFKCGSQIGSDGRCDCDKQPANVLIEGLSQMAQSQAEGQTRQTSESAQAEGTVSLQPENKCSRCEKPGTVDLGDSEWACSSCLAEAVAKDKRLAQCGKCQKPMRILDEFDPFADYTCEDCEWDQPAGMITLKGIAEVAGNPEPQGGRPLADLARQVLADDDIPDESEITTGGNVFGVEIQFPRPEWSDEKLTKESADGGPGQIVAVNAALTSAGYGGKRRHHAAQVILDAYGPIEDREVTQIGSINDITKAEAHIILSFFEKALPYQLHDYHAAIAQGVPCLQQAA